MDAGMDFTLGKPRNKGVSSGEANSQKMHTCSHGDPVKAHIKVGLREVGGPPPIKGGGGTPSQASKPCTCPGQPTATARPGCPPGPRRGEPKPIPQSPAQGSPKPVEGPQTSG